MDENARTCACSNSTFIDGRCQDCGKMLFNGKVAPLTPEQELELAEVLALKILRENNDYRQLLRRKHGRLRPKGIM